MEPKTIKRRVELVNLVENSEHLIDIPRVHDLMSLMVELSGTLTVAVAAATSVPTESPAELLKRIDFIANGKDVLEQVPFTVAVFGNYDRDFVTESTAPGTPVAAYPFRAVAFLDRAMVRSVRPKDTAFQAYLANLLQLRITTGTVDDIITKGGATVTLSNTTIEVSALTILEKAQDQGEGKWVRKRSLQSEVITGANSNLRLRVPVGNHVRQITLHALDGGEPSDVLINSIQFVADGVDVRHNLTYSATRSVNRARVKVAPPAGFAIIDPIDSTEVGKASNFWNLKNSSLAEVVLDVAAPVGAASIEMVTDEVIGIAG